MTVGGEVKTRGKRCRYINAEHPGEHMNTHPQDTTAEEDRGLKPERGNILKDMQASDMSVFLAVFCAVSVFQLCHGVSSSGECYFNAKASCEHNGRVFDIGEAWINDECFQCVCFEPFGVGCCEHGKQPVDFPPWCEAVRKPDSCTVAVVMKANHKLPCLFGGKNRFRAGEGRLLKSENDPLF